MTEYIYELGNSEKEDNKLKETAIIPKKETYNSKSIKNLDLAQRPVELMLRNGVESLSDNQLLAILINSGTSKKNALEVSNEIINTFGMANLSTIDIHQLKEIDGIGNTKACRIVAAIEFAKRIDRRKNMNEQTSIKSPKDIQNVLNPIMKHLNIEVFLAIYLDTKNNILGIKEVTRGVIDCVLVTPAVVYKEAITRKCKSIIVSHNHPTGDALPSTEDVNLTLKLKNSGEIIGIKLLDHIIYGNEKNYYSFAENGYL